MAVNIDSLQIEIEATSSEAAKRVQDLADALTNLKAVAKGGAGLTTVSKQLQALASAAASLNNTGIGNLKELAPALNGLSSIQKSSGLNSTINALKKLPEVSASLKEADLGEFATQMNQVASAVRPLATEMQKVSNGFAAFPIRIQKIIQSNAGLAASNNKTAKSFGVLGTGISSVQAKFGVYTIVFRRIASAMSDWVKSANDYIENVNLFQVSMGEFYDEAFAYAELLNDRLGIDPSEWMRAQGVFMSMANGFGLARKQAYDLSEGLTELAYDLSSLYNEDTEQSILRLQSALSGEIEPIRRLGISISQATLQEYALAHGIDESVMSMTEQEKALLRSLVLMEGAGRIGAIGDFARTLESPANAMRVLSQQITQLGRALGTVLLPIIVQIIPWVQAFVEVLTDAIRALATLVGFTMPEWETSDWATGITNGAEDTEGAINGVTNAAKEMKKALLGIDELTILEPTSAGTSVGDIGTSGWASDLEIPNIWDKDAISQIQTQADELKEKLKDILYNYILPIGVALAEWKIAHGILDFFNKIKGIKCENLLYKISFAISGLGLFLDGWDKIKEAIDDIIKNGPNLTNVTQLISGFAEGLGVAFAALGNVKLGGAFLVISGLSGIVSSISDMVNNGIDFDNATNLVRNVGVFLAGIGLWTKNPILTGGGMILTGLTLVVRNLADVIEAFRTGDWSGVDKVEVAAGLLLTVGGFLTAIGKIKSVTDKIGAGGAITGASETLQDVSNAVGGSSGSGLNGTLKNLAQNLGWGVLIVTEVAAAAVIIVGAIAVLGYELEEVGKAWEPVIDNGATVAAGVGLGTTAIAAVGLATYGLGTLGATAAINIGIGTAILLELGVATGLFIVEIWAIGKGLDEIGQAWQPVLDNGETIASGIALGTSLLVGIGVVTAALGAATVASVGLLPVAIGLGTAILVELAAAFVLFTESLVDVADELNFNLAPSLRNLNETLPQLTNDVSDFVDFMGDFAGEISSYTDSMGSITWDSIVSGFQRLFAGNPIQALTGDVEDITTDTRALNAKLQIANPEIEKAIDLTSDYISLMDSLKLNIDGSSNISLASDMFTNLKEVGKQLVVGFSDGVSENAFLAYNTMKTFGTDVVSNIKTGIESAKPAVRTSLENLFTGVKVKVPRFSITGSFDLEKMSVPKINVSTYALGGFPDHGEMFIAREQGPELVGRIGNRTAVANNDQIVSGIATANEGVINAIIAVTQQIISAIEENSGDVYMDGDKVGERVTAYQNRQNRMYGKTLQRV